MTGTGVGKAKRRRVPTDPAELVGPLALASVVSSLFSVFAFGVLLGLALLAWCWDCLRRRRLVLELPRFYWPLFLFMALAGISIVASPEPLVSASYLRKFVKLIDFALIYTYSTRLQLRRALECLLALAGLSALLGVVQYFWLFRVTLLNRIVGFMSHWMTFSGQMMICGVLTLAILLAVYPPFRTAVRKWAGLSALFGLFCGVTLLSMTRSAWAGLAAGCLVVLTLFRPRLGIAGLALACLFFLVLPESFHARLTSAFDLRDTTTRGRMELFKTGLALVQEHPWTGTGPRLVQAAAARRVDSEFPQWMYQHLHNNPVQIAAELGIPALLAWLAVWIRILVDLFRVSRSRDELTRALAWGGIGTLVAVHLMGLFEYNFGDSEILVLTLFAVTAAYTVHRRGVEPGVSSATV